MDPIATIFTTIGGASGLIALVVSIFAKIDSKKSNEIAQRSEKRSTEANVLAADSNRIAVDARDLAEEANTISLRTEQRDTESNLVSWSYSWPEPGTCQVTNTGRDEALHVVTSVAVDGEHMTGRWDSVPAGESVFLTLPELRNELARRRAEFRAEEHRYAEASRGPYGFAGIPPMEFPLHADVIVSILWKTPLDKQRESVLKDPGTKLYF